ncbi:MAG: ParB N-terminal domain-containing protein [Rhodobacteraceae bacterium]|nr:ParB N-terminal domain-containing protein [Paracoccaceae bacterium]
MKSPTLQMTGHVPVAEIDTRNRLRPVSDAGVESLIASIGEVGVMKDPIHVRRKKNGDLVLIAGGHRLEAAKRLGWETIEAKVWVDVTDDWSRLMEIDDNLAGAEMNPLDTAVFLAERKRLYEKLHPEAKAATGSALAAKRWDAADTMSVASFARATAEKFGMSDRHVRRLIEAGTKLGVDSARLRQAARPVTLKDLIEIAKIGEVTERYAVIDALIKGEAKSAGEARRVWIAKEKGSAAPEKDPAEDAFQALVKVWARAPMAARRRFMHEFADDLAELEGGAE